MKQPRQQGSPFDIQDASTWIIFVVFAVALSISLNALINFSAEQASAARANQLEQRNTFYNGVRLVTSKGMISLDFYHPRAPLTIDNFINLVQRNYYDGMRFHRVVPGLFVQAGDPVSKDLEKKSQWGSGGPGYTIVSEESRAPMKRGAVATVQAAQEDTAHGSQFFILTAESAPQLSDTNTVFAQVVEGLDVVDEITNMPTDESGIPQRPVMIRDVTLY